jgi:hypothetical protein
MKGYLKEKGVVVWKEAIGRSSPLNNKSKFAAQKEEKKNDALDHKTIFNGLSIFVEEILGQCTSTKYLWMKLEKTYEGVTYTVTNCWAMPHINFSILIPLNSVLNFSYEHS